MGSSMSKDLRLWQTNGVMYKYGEFDIFYKRQSNIKKKDGSVLVCLHTVTLSSRQWAGVWPQLVERFNHVIAIDLLGHGFSGKPYPYSYSIEDWANQVEEILVENKIRTFHIVSHGTGALVACELLARQSNCELQADLRIKTACLCSVDIFPGVTHDAPVTELLTDPCCGACCAHCLCFSSYSSRFRESFSGPKPVVKDFWLSVQYMSGYKAVVGMPSCSNITKEQRERFIEAVQTTKTPVCAMYDPSDQQIASRYIKHWYSTFPDIEVHNLDPDTAHFGPLGDPDGFLNVYLIFLRTHF